MKRYRYAFTSGNSVQNLNRLLNEGWQPVRETVVAPSEAAAGEGEVLVLLEREDEFPLLKGEIVPGGVSFEEVGKIDLFDGFTGNEVREILGACETFCYDAGTTIIEAGVPDHDKQLYLLIDGQIEIRLPALGDAQADETLVVELGPLEVFGEVSFFAGTTHGASAVAVSPVQVLALSRGNFDELLQAQRPAAYKLIANSVSLLADRLHATNRWVWELLKEEQNARIARSWRKFREQASGLSSSPSGFFKSTSAFG